MTTETLPAPGRPAAPRRLKSLRADTRMRRGPVRWIVLAAMVVVGLVMASPFLLLVLNSLKSEADYLRGGPLALPTEISFDAWTRYIDDVNYPVALGNSVVISGLVAVFGVTVALLAAYGLGIGRVRGNAAVVGVLLFATMLPQEALLYPLYYGADAVGLRNTVWSVIVIFTVLQGAFGTYLLASVMSTFPREVLEAAQLDGATRWQMLWRIVFPMLRPTLSVLLVFFFVWTWNEFLIPLVLLLDPSAQTVPIALASLKGQQTIDITELNAGSLLSLLPTLIFFLIFQRTLTRGVAAGSTK
jgi:raffinose/stachyose/melibiose transport system permease protein